MASEKQEFDPRGLIRESYRMDGITLGECRSIFLDWALGSPDGADMKPLIQAALEVYEAQYPDHPMTLTLREGLTAAQTPARRGGARGRRA